MIKLMVIVSCILMVGFAWWKFNSRIFGDAMSPFNVLFFMWVVPFLMQFSELSDLQEGIAVMPMAIILTATVIMIAALLAFQPRYIANDDLGIKSLYQSVSVPKIFWFSLALLIVSSCAKIIVEFSDGIPLLLYIDGTANSAALHRIGKDSKFQIVAQSLSIGGVLSWYCWLRAINQKYIKLAALFLALIPLLVGILKMSKSDVLEPIFMYVMVYFYMGPKSVIISFAKNVLTAILVGAVLLTITQVRLSGQGAVGSYADVIELNKNLNPFLRDLISLPYGYMVMNFENFSRYVEMSDFELRLGTSMFRPLLSLFMQGHLANELLHEIVYFELTPAANVGTFLRDLYIEGGIAICLLGAFWNALLVRLAYTRLRERLDDVAMITYVIFLFPWFWIFFTNMFSVLTTFTNCFIASVILFLSRIPENQTLLHK